MSSAKHVATKVRGAVFFGELEALVCFGWSSHQKWRLKQGWALTHSGDNLTGEAPFGGLSGPSLDLL